MTLPLESSPPTMSFGVIDRLRDSVVSARFFHAPHSLSPPDEAALARWWQRFADPELDRLVDATLEQGFDVCAANLRLQEACEHEDDDHFLALCDYYAVCVRQVAVSARQYFMALCLQERIACIDAAIAVEAATARRAHDVDAEAFAAHDGEARPALLADLHAHRIRLRTQWDASVIALARQSAQPVSLLAAHLQDRLLPAACAETPMLGGPHDVAHRRADVLAAMHRVTRNNGSDENRWRMLRLDAERIGDLAEKEVELALATLTGTQAELVPVRALVASAEARCQRLRRHAATIAVDARAVADAHCALHAARDREIETRGRTYLALIDLFLAAGCGWPILSDPASSDPTRSDAARSDTIRVGDPPFDPAVSASEVMR
jgi:hypothetical protein